MTQNRYYSNLAQGAYISNSGGLNNSQTNLIVSSNVSWPSVFPFAVRAEPGTLNEEVFLITAGAGSVASPYVMVRGYDSTLPRAHPQNAPIIPGIIQLDLAEPQQHLTLTGSGSGAHGLPSSAWNGGTMQLIAGATVNIATGVVPLAPIPQYFYNLRLIVNAKSSYAAGVADVLEIDLNGFTGAQYGAAYAGYNNAVTNGSATSVVNYGRAGQLWTSQVTQGVSKIVVDFPSYSDSVWQKGWTYQSFGMGNSTSTLYESGGAACMGVTGPITALYIYTAQSANFVPNSTFFLYGY